MTYTRVKTYWILFWKFRKYPLMWMLAYRGDFIFWTIVSVLWTLFNFFFFSLIIQVKGNIGGWDFYEMYVLLAVFTMLDGFTWSFFFHNARVFTEAVFNGNLSMYLLKPLDAQFLLSVADNSYTNILRVFIGLGILFWALQKTEAQVTLLSGLFFIVLFCFALLFIYSLWFIVATGSLWFEKLNNINEIVPALRRVYQVPRTVFTGIASFIFTVVLPLGLISSVPSEVLLGKSDLALTSYFMVFTVVIFAISRWFFHVSLKKYTSVGN